MAYAFADSTGTSNHTVQYFEMFGHRAMYVDGWKAVTRHTSGDSFDDDVWELYNLSSDPSECNDLAAEQPERLAQMIEQWWIEAETYGVLPLDDRGVELFGARFETTHLIDPIVGTPIVRRWPHCHRKARHRSVVGVGHSLQLSTAASAKVACSMPWVTETVD